MGGSPELLTWVLPAVAASALVAAFVGSHPPGLFIGDTVVLVRGTHRIAFCLSHGISSNCEPHPAHSNLVGPFAPFQYVPAFVFTQFLRMGDATVLRALVIISTLSFCALIGLSGWTTSQTGRRSAPALTVLILTTSPLIFYAWTTFGESLAALLIALMTVAALRRWPPIVLALTGLLACITKETVFPIVATLGAVSLWATPIGTRPLRREHWLGLGCGVLLGLGVNAAFDWFRYHQLTNAAYLAPKLQVPGVGRRLGLSVSLWLAPNGGTALFWPLVAALVIGLIAIGSASLVRKPMLSIRTVPALGVICSLLLLTGSLASWWAPFGGSSWGPRLMLPAIPAIVILAVTTYSAELEVFLRRTLAGTLRTVVLTLAVIIVSLPQVNILDDLPAFFGLFAPDTTCPNPTGVGLYQSSASQFYGCLNHAYWNKHWVLPETFRALTTIWGVILALGFCLLWVWLIQAARASLSSGKRQGEVSKVAAAMTTAVDASQMPGGAL